MPRTDCTTAHMGLRRMSGDSTVNPVLGVESKGLTGIIALQGSSEYPEARIDVACACAAPPLERFLMREASLHVGG